MVKVEPDLDLSSSGNNNTSGIVVGANNNNSTSSGSGLVPGILASGNNSTGLIGGPIVVNNNSNSSSTGSGNNSILGLGPNLGLGSVSGVSVTAGGAPGPLTPATAAGLHLGSGLSVGLSGRVEMKLIEPVVASFRVAKLFRENTERINSIDFSPSGDTLITSSDDDSIVIYDCEKGTMKRTLNSKKYGVDLIHYTHADNTAIHSSNKVDDTIRYLSLHDNKYIRYFPGHTKKVVTLCMSPVDDTFLSGSLDRTIRLWDLKSNNCQGLMHLLGRPVANFDPEGLIFAVGINSESVKLYDLRSFDKGPFNTFKLPIEATADWTGLKFSPDGKLIMIFTNGNIIHLIDSFTGAPLHCLSGHVNNKGIPLEASFSPDSQFVFSGGTDGRIHVWNATNGNRVAILSHADHNQPVQCVQFNPKFMLLASACSNMAFWVPPYNPTASDE